MQTNQGGVAVEEFVRGGAEQGRGGEAGEGTNIVTIALVIMFLSSCAHK